MITEIDQMVGELLAELSLLGLSENTIIVYGSDHGLLMGEYGTGGKALLYDLASKFPCIIYDPGAPGKMRGIRRWEVVSSLDLTVTLLDYAGVEPGSYMTGRSLKPMVRGESLKIPWRKGLFLENMYTGRDTPLQEGYVDGEWKYIRYYKVPSPYSASDVEKQGETPAYEMLFSLNDDTGELHNLADDPELAEKLHELRHSCDTDLARLLKRRADYAAFYNISVR
jgi:arylsulfatase A-like enzyme